MENRYLYRGKRIDNGEWVEGYLSYPFCTEKGNESYYFYAKDSLGFFCRCVVDASTICQCTAMPDKNKKLVFEHDIVWDSDERAFYEIIWNQEDMCWNVEDADGHKSEFEECYESTIEVNGNRFDNPELLEV